MNNLFIIGAQRSGSTLLAKTLSFHPNIKLYSPINPEPKYFLDKNYQGKQTYTDMLKKIDGDYDYFLEKSVSYIEHDNALQRISCDLPNAKILVIFREPVSRCWSNYKYTYENGIEKREFLSAIKNISDAAFDPNISVNPFDYIERGFYDRYLEKVLKIFPKKNIKVLIFEEYIKSTENLINIFEWLNLKKINLPSNIFASKINQTSPLELKTESVHDLAHLYVESILNLEDLIDTKIDIWREIFKKRGIIL